MVLKIGGKQNYKYFLNGVYLDEIEEQRDMGIIISNNLSPREHIVHIMK